MEQQEALKLQEAKVQSENERPSDVSKANSPQENEQSEKERRTAESERLSNVLKNVSLRIRVDPETKEINVTMVDKETRAVVRIIPPEELSNLNEGYNKNNNLDNLLNMDYLNVKLFSVELKYGYKVQRNIRRRTST